MTDDDLDRHIRAIIAREGGWVDDPDDSGGPTNYGITLETFREFLRSGPDGRSYGTKHHREMAPEDARKIYEWYFRTQGLAELIDEFSIPDELVPLVMDLRTLHSQEGCRKIIKAAKDAAHGGYARELITLSRIRYMLEVAERSHKDRKYVRGWMHRALKAIGMWPPKPETKEV